MVGDIILIGPYGVGKTEIANLLSARLKQPNYSLDQHQSVYYKECRGYSRAEAKKREIDDPWLQPFSAHAIKRFLQDHGQERCVMDFGAHHPVLDGALFTNIKALLQVYAVVLMLPSPDQDESLRILVERNNLHVGKKYRPHARMNRYFIQHPAYYALAKQTVYTKNKTELDTCEEILALLSH